MWGRPLTKTLEKTGFIAVNRERWVRGWGCSFIWTLFTAFRYFFPMRVFFKRKHGEGMGRKLFVAGRAIVLAYAVSLAILAGCQRQLIYHPQRADENRLLNIARGEGLEPWRDEDDEIVGWRTPASGTNPAENAVVVFHGNAGYALHRTYYAEGFRAVPGADTWQVHLFEYPGYGSRCGRPSEKAIKRSADEAVRPLREKGMRVFLVGESLGSGVACYLAGKHPRDIAGLLLITPFTGFADVGRHHYPVFPVGLLLRERYDNRKALEAYRGPAVFLVAGRDEVIPAPLGLRLHEGYEGPKKLIVQEDRGHNTLMLQPQAAWWSEAAAFLLDPGKGTGVPAGRPPDNGVAAP